MKITFNIKYYTRWGENLHITGSIPELGLKDIENAPEMLCNGNGIWSLTIEISDQTKSFTYNYLIKHQQKILLKEGCEKRIININPEFSSYQIYNLWKATSACISPFYSSAFTKCICNKENKEQVEQPLFPQMITLSVLAIGLRIHQRLALVGSNDYLGNWNKDKAIALSQKPNSYLWYIHLDADKLTQTFEYKFIIIDDRINKIDWETGDNRNFTPPPLQEKESIIITGLQFNYSSSKWKAAGVAIPVFSLKSENSFGIGEFNDLKLLIDWAEITRQQFIQILPINDTTMLNTWIDSYPYHINSIFALHPIYLNLDSMEKLTDKNDLNYFNKIKTELNSLDLIDYEKVWKIKQEYFKLIYNQTSKKIFNQQSFKNFFDENKTWLIPYAAFCYLRDKYGTPDFNEWEDYSIFDENQINSLTDKSSEVFNEIAIHYFLQYHLHLQLSAVHQYARSKGIVLKGDIPIGISRTSVDTWTNPDLFNLDSQAGAPPDDFAEQGQNWGFPTYNWNVMASDGYDWWKRRLKKMAEYFDAYRIDHILGFFRIWEIPLTAVQGLLGHFTPALPYSAEDLKNLGFHFDRKRHLLPFIRMNNLNELFGNLLNEVINRYLIAQVDGSFKLKPEISNQRNIENKFAESTDAKEIKIKNGLLSLCTEVLFVEDSVNPNLYHPRITAQNTFIYRELLEDQRKCFDKLYVDFFYHRHNDFWKNEALMKLPALMAATNMLVCAEDLGMIPDCVPVVMKQLQILGLEIQRMPKETINEFGDTSQYPYLSVCSSSTHDMSTIREWWQENQKVTQRFYNNILHEHGKAPEDCRPWICEKIIDQSLSSPSMLVILPLADWLSMDAKLRRKEPHEERINIPSVARHYWRYRMHLTLESLIKENTYNYLLKNKIIYSGRG